MAAHACPLSGSKVLENKLSEYIRLAAGGETDLVMDRDPVIAELARRVRAEGRCLARTGALALDPFLDPVRTLDALQLASIGPCAVTPADRVREFR